ncbi:hypothetical protein DFH07DRAFT_951812 [Mycena maculata]|uniref:Uncharacterized protein n=1 Tax=Mycena maculata TaxID=230809 RepID=A0AAD7K0M8_9AGAR|nr:hypothetical protein DFH07DRAFT_951812 [Mycena maculata]
MSLTLAGICRLAPALQLCVHLDNHWTDSSLYIREGPSILYCCGRVPTATLAAFRQAAITRAAFLAELEVKYGFAADFDRRRRGVGHTYGSGLSTLTIVSWPSGSTTSSSWTMGPPAFSAVATAISRRASPPTRKTQSTKEEIAHMVAEAKQSFHSLQEQLRSTAPRLCVRATALLLNHEAQSCHTPPALMPLAFPIPTPVRISPRLPNLSQRRPAVHIRHPLPTPLQHPTPMAGSQTRPTLLPPPRVHEAPRPACPVLAPMGFFFVGARTFAA